MTLPQRKRAGLRLSDQKFIAQSRESREERKASVRSAPTADELMKLRGLADSSHREAQILLGGADGEYEPVYFLHPETGRRVYGWLVSVEEDGNGRVEIGGGEYALVPPNEVRRIGSKQERESVRQELRRVIGKVAIEQNDRGVRADIHETMSAMPLGLDGDHVYLLNLAYATAMGVPNDEEIRNWVKRFHPTASIVEMDDSMPGRLAVAVVEAEMDGAVGGEVLETLDPSADIEKEARGGSAAKGPFDRTSGPMDWLQNVNRKINPWSAPEVGLEEAARHLMSTGQNKLIQDIIKIYMRNGGARAITSTGGKFNTERILGAALDVLKRVKPALWKEIAQEAVEAGAGRSLDQSKPPVETVTPESVPTAPSSIGGPTSIPDTLEFEDDPLEFEEDTHPVNESDILDTTNDSMSEIDTGVLEHEPEVGFPGAVDLGNPNEVGPEGPQHIGPPTSKATREQAEAYIAAHPILSKVRKDWAAYNQAISDLMTNGIPRKQSMKRTTAFEAKAAPRSKRAYVFESAKDLQRHNLPPSAHELHAGMKMHKMARRGDYIVGTVEWDASMTKTMSEDQMKGAVVTFVQRVANDQSRGCYFGAIGKIRVIALNAKKGTANVQFATEMTGNVPLIGYGDDAE